MKMTFSYVHLDLLCTACLSQLSAGGNWKNIIIFIALSQYQ